MILDFSADQAVFDNLVEVTYTSVRTAGNETVSVPDAGFYEMGTKEGAPSFGVYTKGLARFTVRSELLNVVGGAKPRDTVTLDSTVYTVLAAQEGQITQFWQLDAVNLVLAADLRQTATILRPPPGMKDEGGRLALSTYSTLYADVPCRLQPLESSRTEALGRTTSPRRYVAYLGIQLWPLRARDVLVVDGVGYTIDTLGSAERIDQLPEIQCTLID